MKHPSERLKVLNEKIPTEFGAEFDWQDVDVTMALPQIIEVVEAAEEVRRHEEAEPISGVVEEMIEWEQRADRLDARLDNALVALDEKLSMPARLR